MKKVLLTMLGLALLVSFLSGVSYGWQGRMGGMGDPFGLISDESDYLIHPAKIAKGEGVRFYGDYRFTYTGVTDWDYNLDQFDTAGALTDFFHYGTSGQEFKHNALLGATFPLGPGRMGAFFTYDGMRGDYDGHEDRLATSHFAEYNLTKDFDNFALRLLYGLPVMGMDAGLELGIAYRNEQQKTLIQTPSDGILNDIESVDIPYNSLLGFMIPYDSKYWELLWKAGVEKQLGALGIAVSLRGGYIISSDNNYEFLFGFPNDFHVDMKGDVTGWRIGSDIWLRYAMEKGLNLPFLFSIDYAAKKRDGDGIGVGASDAGTLYDYTHKEQSLDIKAGGGIEKKLGDNALIAGGIYYNYLQRKDDASFFLFGIPYFPESSDFPFHQEHRVIVRLAGELELSPVVTLRMGLVPFLGWVMEDFKFHRVDTRIGADNISVNGLHWGIAASLGGTIKIPSVHMTLEPFINGGWQQYNLDGDGAGVLDGTPRLWELDKSRSEWNVGGGLSILYDL